MIAFKELFANFLDQQKQLKIIQVASCDLQKKPNSAAKMLVSVEEPNQVYFLDFPHNQTYENIKVNPQLSISFMDDAAFTGYRLTGTAEILEKGSEFEVAKRRWSKRLIAYEADRIVKRITGQYSTTESESKLPEDFIIVKFVASEGAVIKPGRVFRAKH